MQVKQTIKISEKYTAEWWCSFEKNGLKTDFFIRNNTQWVQIFETMKGYKYFALPIRKIAGWLNSININKVKPEVRPILETYQEECDDIFKILTPNFTV